MRALILQHQDDAPAGLVLDALASQNVPLQVVHLDRAEPLPEPEGIAIAVTLGSDASADDTAREWIPRELEWLSAADRAGTAILGLCFGGQALALALGGSVHRAERPERGWVQIQSEEPEYIAPGPWLTWHDDAFVPPPGAHVLARNQSGVQAFELGHHLGLQFHPEVTPQIVADWVRGSHEPGLDGQGILEGTARESLAAAANAARLFTGFLDRARAARC